MFIKRKLISSRHLIIDAPLGPETSSHLSEVRVLHRKRRHCEEPKLKDKQRTKKNDNSLHTLSGNMGELLKREFSKTYRTPKKISFFNNFFTHKGYYIFNKSRHCEPR